MPHLLNQNQYSGRDPLSEACYVGLFSHITRVEYVDEYVSKKN